MRRLVVLAAVVALASPALANGRFPETKSVAFRPGHAHEFTPVGLMSKIIWWKSVKLARSDPQRVYVTGYQVTQVADDGGPIAPTVHVERTDDAGGKWTEMPIGGFTLASNPMVLILAV